MKTILISLFSALGILLLAGAIAQGCVKPGDTSTATGSTDEAAEFTISGEAI